MGPFGYMRASMRPSMTPSIVAAIDATASAAPLLALDPDGRHGCVRYGGLAAAFGLRVPGALYG